jgi:SEC-C motif
MNRKPPASVIKHLRTEVGFGCPVPECGNPYLEWHHFDPPWSVEQHHNPEGMVALCAEHHKKADNCSYTNQQLSAFKRNKVDPALVRGRFDWRRNKLLAVVGGNYYYETPRVLVIDGHEVVSLTRDEDGYLLLNVQMLSLSTDVRARLVENCWENIGNPVDLISPPSGEDLSIRYANGDSLGIHFYVLENGAEFQNKFEIAAFDKLEFPLTVAEVNCEIGGTDIKLSPIGTTIRTNQFTGCFMAHCGAGLVANLGMKWRQNWSLIPTPESRLSPCPCGSGRRYKHCHGSLS